MANLLIPGTIEVIFSDEKHPNHSQFNTTDPWLQVLSVKKFKLLMVRLGLGLFSRMVVNMDRQCLIQCLNHVYLVILLC